MPNSLTFLIAGKTGKRFERLTVPMGLLVAFALAILAGSVLFGFMVFGYQDLRRSIVDNGKMALTIASQREKIAHQQLQIQSFAREIDGIKDKLLMLDRFEAKIRAVANIDFDQETVFGVGGAAAEDLDPSMDLAQRYAALMREMVQQVEEMDAAALQRQKCFETLLIKLTDQRDLLAATPSIQPAEGWMSSRFGRRVSPFSGRNEIHNGMDIANHAGTPVLATADGVVSFAGKRGSMGLTVVIDHGYGLRTRYAHLSKTLKKKGATVARGDTVALMGNSGRSTGPHVHYEVYLNGEPVDPATYILN